MKWDATLLRESLARQTRLAFALHGDDGVPGAQGAEAIAASVLVPIVARPEALTVLFTQRTAQLKSHSGQVSFPGGRAEPGDATPEFTALREAREEIGLAPERVEILARLPDYHTRTGYRVTPVIGLLTPPFELAPDPREVDEIFEVPLDFLLDPRNHRRQTRQFQGQTVGFYEMPYRSEAGERYIWGVTAGMLVNLYRRLCADPPDA